MLKFFFPDLSNRLNAPELMDDFNSPAKKLIKTVEQFRFINFFLSRHRSLLKKYFYRDMLNYRKNIYKILDIGAGGCDIPIWFVKFCRRKKISIEITCIDHDRRIIDYALRTCRKYKEIRILEKNVDDIGDLEDYDYVFANNFLHHFGFYDIERIIALSSKATNRIFLFADIKRSKSSFFLYTLFSLVFLHNSFAFYDGRLSVLKGFMKVELIELFKQNENIEIIEKLPGRIIVLGKKQPGFNPGV